MIHTNLYLGTEAAEKLFKEYASKPLKPGESGSVTEATFEAHFRKYSMTYLQSLAAQLQRVDNRPGTYRLIFREYLPKLPSLIAPMSSTIVDVEIKRYNSQSTKARAGRYEAPGLGFAATVEACVDFSDDRDRSAYVQNITVSGRDLSSVQWFNTLLSQGILDCFLVNAF